MSVSVILRSASFWCDHFGAAHFVVTIFVAAHFVAGPFWNGPLWHKFHANYFFFFEFVNFLIYKNWPTFLLNSFFILFLCIKFQVF